MINPIIYKDLFTDCFGAFEYAGQLFELTHEDTIQDKTITANRKNEILRIFLKFEQKYDFKLLSQINFTLKFKF